MLHWFRTCARALAVLLLVSFGMLGVSSVVHSDACHDGCIVSLVPHDPSHHSVRTPASGEGHTLHCVVCQWTRLPRPAIAAVHAFSPHVDGDDRVPSDVVSVPPVFPAAQPPLRSPPIAPAPSV